MQWQKVSLSILGLNLCLSLADHATRYRFLLFPPLPRPVFCFDTDVGIYACTASEIMAQNTSAENVAFLLPELEVKPIWL